MKRRFVIGVDKFTAEQHTRFKDSIDGDSIYWWHWIDGMWLITTDDEDITTSTIRDKIKEINASASAVVFEFPEDITWSALGIKNAEGKQLSDWLRGVWAKN